MLNYITVLSFFLLFLMCKSKSLQDAVTTRINCTFYINICCFTITYRDADTIFTMPLIGQNLHNYLTLTRSRDVNGQVSDVTIPLDIGHLLLVVF